MKFILCDNLKEFAKDFNTLEQSLHKRRNRDMTIKNKIKGMDEYEPLIKNEEDWPIIEEDWGFAGDDQGLDYLGSEFTGP